MPIARVFSTFILVAALLLPQTASAFFSFGGRVISVVPCLSGLGPSLHITIIPSGTFAPNYIWTPATLTLGFGPPRNPGQQVLGIADTPYACAVGKVPLPGLRMTIVGTSAI